MRSFSSPGQEARDSGEVDQDPASLADHPEPLSGLGLSLGAPATTNASRSIEDRFTRGSTEEDASMQTENVDGSS